MTWASEAGLVVNFWQENIEKDVSVLEWDTLLLFIIIMLSGYLFPQTIPYLTS